MAEYIVSYHPSNPSSCLNDEDEEGFDSIEEGLKTYGAGGFLPVQIGGIYGGKYKVVRKIGYGRSSTVWLAKEERFGQSLFLADNQ